MIYHYRIGRILPLILFMGIFSYLCGDEPSTYKGGSSEQTVIQLPLEGEVSERYAELSGLTWYKDQLILLPQYPDRFSSSGMSSIFRIPKKEIVDQIDQISSKPKLVPIVIEFEEQGIPDEIPGFQGYESILFVDNKVYLTIETKNNGYMQGYLIEGDISENMNHIVLDHSSLRLLPMPSQLKNFAYESMIIANGNLYILYEANGENINPFPQMLEVNLENGTIRQLPFLNLEYRITDATALDKEGYFWVINYFWPGDNDILNPGIDPLAELSSPALSYSADNAIERLVEMRYSIEGIKLNNTPPIVIGSGSKHDSRNWEGIVRLDNRGFILVTDKHPQTILGFLPN